VARLIFVRPDGPLTLYYGNDATRAPLYDIQSLRWSLGLNPAFAPSALGPEAENPRFAPLPPLAFAPSAGAPLEVVRWRNERRFSVGPREDIYSLTLAPEDLARLRPDLGDLRVADAEDRQVPYVLEPSAQDARVHLRHEKDATPARRGERTRALTRCRLWIADSSAGLLRLPLRSLELAFTETFFSRPARVLAPSERGARREHEVELYSGTLARGAAQGAAPAAEPPPISLPLDGAARAELFLEIDEGDNAPLTITAAAAVVRVPRLSFKARPGEYRLLLGNAEAAAPRYDIAALAREVLAYSAVVVEAAARTENPAFRRRAGDYFQNAPPTVLLWGTLIVAVVGLVFLTARLLRSPQG
jgi:hypothetical protein